MTHRNAQSLRNKTILIVGGSIIGFLVIMYLFAGVLLWQGFSQLERREANANVNRIHNRIDSELSTISSKVRDWAAWDDAWDYMSTRSKTFAAGNLDPNTTLSNLNADLLFYINPQRELVAALQWDPFKGKSTTVDPELTKLILSEPFNAIWSDWKNPSFDAKGIVTVSGVSWLMAARPVTKTDHTGEIRGTFFLAERVTPQRIETMAKELQFNIKLHEQGDKKRKLATTYTRNIINTGIPFQNFNGTPAFSFEVKFKREVMQQGKLTLISMLALITCASIGIGFLILSLLDRRILRRIDALRRGAKRISITGFTQDLLEDQGDDEIRALTVSINHMITALDHKNNEIRAIFENVTFGFFLVDLNGTIQSGHTASSLRILKTNSISGKNLADVVHFTPTQKQLLQLTLMQVSEDLIPDDISLRQLPQRVIISDTTVSLQAALVRDKSGAPYRLLISIADATALEQAEQENRSNRTILTVLRGKQVFTSLLFDLITRQANMENMATNQATDALRQELHTLNGNLRCFELNELVQMIAIVENRTIINKADIQALFKSIEQWVTSHSSITGIPWQNKGDHQVWEVNEHMITQIRKYDLSPENLDAFKNWVIDEIRTVPLQELAIPFETLAQTTATKLGKSIDFVVNDSSLRTNPEHFQLLADILPHLIRNAIDHGIETVEERQKSGKNKIGHVIIDFERMADRGLKITVRDDGQGIDVAALSTKALALELIPGATLQGYSNEQKLRLLFHPKLSSKASIEEFSGRGYGMSAVRQRVEDEYGGSIHLASTTGAGTSIVITLPMKHDTTPTAPILDLAL